MLLRPKCFDISRTSLELKKEGEHWIPTEAPMKRLNYGKTYEWELDVVPCKKYKFRIKLPGKNNDSLTGILEIPSPLHSLSTVQAQDSGYNLPPPKISIGYVNSSYAELSWNNSECAESYEVEYEEMGVGASLKTIPLEKQTPNFLALDSLKSCTSYNTYTYALLGSLSSTSSDFEFTTSPNNDVADRLSININVGFHEANSSWLWHNLYCIHNYSINICMVDGSCGSEIMITRPIFHHEVTNTVSNLTDCTDYKIIVRPFYMNQPLREKIINFTTLCKGK